MITKMIEIRDKGTTIAAVAIYTLPCDATEARFLKHCGFPPTQPGVILMCLYDQKATNDPYEWADLGKGSRTMQAVHHYLIDHWGEVTHGQVLDVECILGEKETPKTPEIGARA